MNKNSIKKIVINALPYRPSCDGIGMMVSGLYCALKCKDEYDYQIFLVKNAPDIKLDSKMEIVHTNFEFFDNIKRNIFLLFRLGRKYCNNALLITNDAKLPYFLPKNCYATSVVTDLGMFHLDNVYGKSRSLLWKFEYKYVAKRADFLIAISEFTKKDIVETLHYPEDKIDVLYNGCSERFKLITDKEMLEACKIKYMLPNEYVLFVGNVNPRKNLKRTIEAFIEAKKRSSIKQHLVIAGSQAKKYQEELLSDVGALDDIHFIGYVDDDDMPALYSGSSLFTFATLYEGFGIPIIEAQRCGVPVLTSTTGAAPEIAGDAAKLVNPYDASDIANGIIQVLTDEEYANHLRQLGYENAKRFSWNESADRLNEIIRKRIDTKC